jgi:ribose transport system substrate-binding protein
MNRRSVRVAAVVVGLAATLGLSACASASSGGSSSSSTAATDATTGAATGGSTSAGTSAGSAGSSTGGAVDGIPAAIAAQNEKLLTDALAPFTEFPGPKDGPAAAKDKFVVSIPCSLAAAGCVRMDNGVKAAAAAMGWKELTIDPAFDTNKTIQAIEQAIRVKADAIFLGSIAPTAFQVQVDEARKAGITVIGLANSYPDPTTGNASYDISIRPDVQSQMMGAWLTKAYGGKAVVAAFTNNENPILEVRTKSFQDYAAACPACLKIAVEQPFTTPQTSTTFPSTVQSVIAAHRDVNVAWIAYDGAAASAVPALRETGVTPDKLSVVSMDGDQQNVQWIHDGNYQSATIAVPLEWVGWAAVDEANRAFNKVDFVPPNIPLRLIDKDNADKYLEAGFTGDYDYQSAYKKLWGVG